MKKKKKRKHWTHKSWFFTFFDHLLFCWFCWISTWVLQGFLFSQKFQKIFFWQRLTSWPLPVESRLTLRAFRPNLRTELALNMSSSLVLLIGIVPSGHDSPEILHSWKFSDSEFLGFWPFGLSGGSCSKFQKTNNKIINILNSEETEWKTINIKKLKLVKVNTNGFFPFSWGWSKAGWWWDKTQSIRSPSGLWKR